MKKTWAIYLVLVLLLLVLPAACTPAAEQSLEESATNDSDTTPALLPVTNTPEVVEGKETATSNSAEASDDILSRDEVETAVLIYTRRGGLKGIGPSDREWRFYGDGRVVGSDGPSWQIEPATIENLVTEIMASGFQDLENSYIPEDTCCDRATHVIVIQTAEETYTVETLDGADMPESLEDSLQKINDFLMSLYE
jgi:hypothetical protein